MSNGAELRRTVCSFVFSSEIVRSTPGGTLVAFPVFSSMLKKKKLIPSNTFACSQVYPAPSHTVEANGVETYVLWQYSPRADFVVRVELGEPETNV